MTSSDAQLSVLNSLGISPADMAHILLAPEATDEQRRNMALVYLKILEDEEITGEEKSLLAAAYTDVVQEKAARAAIRAELQTLNTDLQIFRDQMRHVLFQQLRSRKGLRRDPQAIKDIRLLYESLLYKNHRMSSCPLTGYDYHAYRFLISFASLTPHGGAIPKIFFTLRREIMACRKEWTS